MEEEEGYDPEDQAVTSSKQWRSRYSLGASACEKQHTDAQPQNRSSDGLQGSRDQVGEYGHGASGRGIQFDGW